ncbi:DNA topoisomerase I [Pholiota molesta]|nr:DNA topoisomerase I [Pholiota molesta]
MNGNRSSKAEPLDLSDDDDLPLSQTTRTTDATSVPSRSLKRKKVAYAETSSDDDTPLASSPAKPKPKANGKAKPKQESSDTGDNFEPETKPQNGRASNGRVSKPPKKKVKEESDKSDEDEDKPLQPAKRAAGRKRKVKAESGSDQEMPLKKTTAKPRGKKVKAEEASDAETPKPKRGKKANKDDADSKSPTKKGRKEKKEEEQEEVFRWWENGRENGDDSIKWTTLEHSGVLFPPPYEPLPSSVKMKYNGQLVDLPPDAEEVAGFYAALLETDHAKDATFNKNFFEDWKIVLKKHPPRDGTKIVNFELCDFRPMYEHFEVEKAKKKAMTTEEKKAAKKARDEMEAKYTTCLLDGRKEKVGNFRVEPPGLFRGRGEHPKKGALKFRVRPEDITLNIGEGASIPVPNMPGHWRAVTHDNTVTWLANWTENINGNHKYVFLAAGSSLKGQSDMQKFEKARELKNHVDRIRENYQVDLRSKVMADRQRATTMYFIDKLALRAGNEKGEDEADTVGCCSLRCEHVTLEAPDFIIFDFLGKDSIRYYNRVQVDPQVFKNIRIFKENKNDDDNLFDRVTTTTLNKHLTSEMKGLTAKVFRTFNASITFQRLLDEENLEGASLQEKLNAYNAANRQVAILCNHQRSAPKTHDQSMEKMRNKYRSFKYERMKLRHALFKIDPKYKKKPLYKDDESDLDDDWIAEYEDILKAKEIEKAEKKFVKENEKLEEDGQKPQKDSVLKERIKEIESEFKQMAKERGTGKAETKHRSAERIEEAIEKITEKIKAFKLQMVDRDAGKEVALGTSKINYLDPRITAAWCQIHDVPIEKMFSKTLITKFPWAMEVEPEWKF